MHIGVNLLKLLFKEKLNMNKPSENEFLELLADVLMAENPLEMNTEMPSDIFDSTGKLIILTTFSKEFNIELKIDQVAKAKTPQDLYNYLT